MPRYILAVMRIEYYPVEAKTPADAWEAYMNDDRLGLCSDSACQGDGALGGETLGHYVQAPDEDGDATGPVLYAEGDLVPEVGLDLSGPRAKAPSKA